MKRFVLVLALFCLVLGAALASAGEAQDAPDLGERDPFVAACAHFTDVGELGGLIVRSCRKSGETELEGNRSYVHLRIATNQGVFHLDATLVKSPWNVSAFIQR